MFKGSSFQNVSIEVSSGEVFHVEDEPIDGEARNGTTRYNREAPPRETTTTTTPSSTFCILTSLTTLKDHDTHSICHNDTHNVNEPLSCSPCSPCGSSEGTYFNSILFSLYFIYFYLYKLLSLWLKNFAQKQTQKWYKAQKVLLLFRLYLPSVFISNRLKPRKCSLFQGAGYSIFPRYH